MLHVVARNNAPTLDDLRYIARVYHGDRGDFAYRAFEYINATLFDGRLPTPLIQWAITAHGSCLGLTRPGHAPVITLHPSLLGGTESAAPWSIDPEMLGYCLAYDVLVHECIHVSVHYVLNGSNRPTSHNNPEWISEVNRLAPLLGLHGVDAQQSKVKRVDNGVDENGKKRTKPARVCEGNIPFKYIATFPHAVRVFLGETGFYTDGVLPFEGAECYA